MLGWTYAAILAAAIGFILIRGEWEERITVLAMFGAAFGTYLIVNAMGSSFNHFSWPLVLNEAVLLGVMLWVAYRSNRFWPLPVASLEIAAFTALLTPLLGHNLVFYAMGIAQGLWAYPQLALLVLAVIRQQNRAKRHCSPT